jgi:hypothetical protein
MTLLRMDNVLVVVDDLKAAVAFFADIGMESRARRPSRDRGSIASSASTAPSAISP